MSRYADEAAAEAAGYAKADQEFAEGGGGEAVLLAEIVYALRYGNFGSLVEVTAFAVGVARRLDERTEQVSQESAAFLAKIEARRTQGGGPR